MIIINNDNFGNINAYVYVSENRRPAIAIVYNHFHHPLFSVNPNKKRIMHISCIISFNKTGEIGTSGIMNI
jgi:hypothetical protein